MQNPNALIAMAQVSQNANNPYAVFCEYMKYCIFSEASDTMTITQIRDAVGREFGLYLPYGIIAQCLNKLQEAHVVLMENHQIRRVGEFDTEEFDRRRKEYKNCEDGLIAALIRFVAKYGRGWNQETAREQLIRVLDRNGLAFDIFVHKKAKSSSPKSLQVELCEMEAMLPEDEEAVEENVDQQPLYTDSFFVGRFVEEILAGDTVEKTYLQEVCAGLMICVGTYQLPSEGTDAVSPQINGTGFFFDTRLLLRFIGCAGEAATASAKDLVRMIQAAGGNIYYYPQTKEEIERAFDDAIRSLTNGYPPKDEEMRIYASRIRNDPAVISVKKASFVEELSKAKIWPRELDTYSETDRIRFGFDRDDLQQYMRKKLRWDNRTIENDAKSIWETHMRRQGNYSEYCGSQNRLPVFVTTNTRLISIAMGYREERPHCSAISGWKHNRLPVISDVKLTCRLWCPSTESTRLSLLYLSANAVAAQRPTQRYLNSIRELAIEFGKNAPEYSGICLPAYFDDNVTDAILEGTQGHEENLNLGTFASSMAELTEWKAKEQEEKTELVTAERDSYLERLDQQEKLIIEGAIEGNCNRLGIIRVYLQAILWWPAVVSVVFPTISAIVSMVAGEWHWLAVGAVMAGFAWAQYFFASGTVTGLLLKWAMPKLETAYDQKIKGNLRKSELPYQDIIIPEVKAQTPKWRKCKKLWDEAKES